MISSSTSTRTRKERRIGRQRVVRVNVCLSTEGLFCLTRAVRLVGGCAYRALALVFERHDGTICCVVVTYNGPITVSGVML